MPQELKVTLARQAELVLSALPDQRVSPDQWVQLARLAQLLEEAAREQSILEILPERRARQDRRAQQASPAAKARMAQKDRRAPRASKVQRALRAAKDKREQQERRAAKDRRVHPENEVQQVLRVPLALWEQIHRSQAQQDPADSPPP